MAHEDMTGPASTLGSYRTTESIIQEIECWILMNDQAKKFENAANHIKSKVKHQLNYLETTFIERPYVKVVLDMWLHQSFEKALDYLENKVVDISTEMCALFNELDSINSFGDISLNLGVTSRLRPWCESEYLRLILEQRNMFLMTPRFEILVSSYFKHFKTSCVKKIFSRCINDIGDNEIYGQKHLGYIAVLREFLAIVSEDGGVQNILKADQIEENGFMKDDTNGRELINTMILIIETSCKSTEGQLPESIRMNFERLKSSEPPNGEWTLKLESLTKEMCKKFLLPIRDIEIHVEETKKIIFVKGIAVFVSKMIEKMGELKRDNQDAQEIKIIGHSSVHIDCHLEKAIWHGMNVVIVTDKLFVDNDVTWDVSGQQGNIATEENDRNFGQPGESGGNVHVFCNQISDGERWTIVADGGDGSDASPKWSEDKFKTDFPSMSTFDSRKGAIETVLKNLVGILPIENRTRGLDILPDYRGDFVVEGTSVDGKKITVSYYRKKNITGQTKKRYTMILCKGSKVGQGGYGGKITFENLSGDSFVSIPFIGKEKRQATAVQIGVYEALGFGGATGRAIGDVGFIHSVKHKEGKDHSEGNYIGFKNDERLKFEYQMSKPDSKTPNSYGRLDCGKIFGVFYAKISSIGNQKFNEDISTVTILARKKKAITRMDTRRHFVEIDERKQLMQSFQIWLSDSYQPAASHDNQIEQLMNQIQNTQTQLHQLTSQSVQPQEKLVRKMYSDSHVADASLLMGGSIGRRPVDSRTTPPISVYCLDILPTESDLDSFLHCIFGQMSHLGSYMCENTKKYRKHLANAVRQNIIRNDVIATVKEFVVSKIKKGHQQEFPIASAVKRRFQETDASEFNWEDELVDIEGLVEEYAKFIESSSTALDLVELEILSRLHQIKIHVYDDQLSSFRFKTTLNPDGKHARYILYQGNGRWQKLRRNENLNNFCERIGSKHFEKLSGKTDCFESLMNWLKTNCTDQLVPNWEEMVKCIGMLNPDDGETPDELSELLMQRFKPNEETGVEAAGLINKMLPDLSFLVERVIDYNKRSISPIFYLHIVNKISKSENWKREFLFLEIGGRLALEDEEPDKASQMLDEIDFRLYELNDQMALLIHKFLIASDWVLEPFRLIVTLDMLLNLQTNFTEIDVKDLENLIPLSLNDFYNEIKIKIWQIDFPWLSSEATNMMLELEDKEGNDFDFDLFFDEVDDLPTALTLLKDRLYSCRTSQTVLERNVEDIISLMKEGRNASGNNQDSDENLLGGDEDDYEDDNENYPLTHELKEEDIEAIVKECKSDTMKTKFNEKRVAKLIKEWQEKGLELSNRTTLVQFLYVYDYAVQKIFSKSNQEPFRLRDTQRVTILMLLTNQTKNKQFSVKGMNVESLHFRSSYEKIRRLAQVSTGEGKSLIVAGVAIALALSGNRKSAKRQNVIDIITSNDVLALRDSILSVADGGLRDLYQYFKVSVANNCSRSVDDRVLAYDSVVVYGELSNFQRDYLLDTFYGCNIRGDRTMDFVIVDEADCMLLDRSNNMLYLTHDIPGMDMLESLYVFIWEKICSSPFVGIDEIKRAIRYDLYGAISKHDLESVQAQLKDRPSQKNALWDHLTERKIIDQSGRLLITDVAHITEKNLDYEANPGLTSKLVFFIQKVAERERRIQISDHLLPFVDRRLDTWLNNALRALELGPDEEYVIDQDRTDSSPDLNPQVIIIDPHTGTDLISSQWDGGLHQFLQLKEGCNLTPQRLKAVFISNMKYLKSYKMLVGVSGSLGSESELLFMRNTYRCEYFTIPTAFPKRFTLKSPKILNAEDSWMQAVIKEVKETIFPENAKPARSLVIFCRCIKDANTFFQRIKSSLPIESANIHRYTRDYEKFAFESNPLQVGHVIITTNLAGRGTDIKISEDLRLNGGLHICLTYFPENERIEEQAMGRAGRNGSPGTGILILCEPSQSHGEVAADITECGFSTYLRMRTKRFEKELRRIELLNEDFETIQREEQLFHNFSLLYAQLKKPAEIKRRKCDEYEMKEFCDSVLDRWALWLDETIGNSEFSIFSSEEFSPRFFEDNSSLKRWYDDPNQWDPKSIAWMTPARSISIAKHIAGRNTSTGNELSKAADVLDQLICSNLGLSNAAVLYYRGFIFLRENVKENGNKFISTLRACETVLNEHINLQTSFYQIVNKTTMSNYSDQLVTSFCVVEGYKQQKDNVIKLLEYFISSIRSLLGSHYCSVSDLKSISESEPSFLGDAYSQFTKFYDKKENQFRFFENTGNQEEKTNSEKEKNVKTVLKINPLKVDDIFESLVTKKCLVYQMNRQVIEDEETVPNRNSAIQRIVNEYDVDRQNLEENLISVFKDGLSERDIEKKLKQKNIIHCTRKLFWETLLKDGTLSLPPKFEDDRVVIMDASKCNNDSKLELSEQIDLDFGSPGYAFYNPNYANMAELQQKNKVMFHKKYVKDVLTKIDNREYRRQKTSFEFNRIAVLNVEKLKSVDLKSFGRLGNDHFRRVNINSKERQDIWKALIDQKIIDEEGSLSWEYEGQEFHYPECPAYENAVNLLVGRTFMAEKVRRQWLTSVEDPRYLGFINFLPLKPYRDMLGDLMATHIISGARVTEDPTFKLKDIVDTVTENEEERKYLVDFLKSRQTVYASTTITPEVYLDFIERDIRTMSDMNNVSSELYHFDLVGLNHVIHLKNRKLSWNLWGLAPLIILSGTVSVGTGICFLLPSLPLKKFWPRLINRNFFLMGGVSDILYAITALLTRSDVTWANYCRQRLRSAIGKSNLVDAIKTATDAYKSRGDNKKFGKYKERMDVIETKWMRRDQQRMHQDVINFKLNERDLSASNACRAHRQVDYQCHKFSGFLLDKINKVIYKKLFQMTETVDVLYHLYGLEKAEVLISSERTKQMTINWFALDGNNSIYQINETLNLNLDESLRQQPGANLLTPDKMILGANNAIKQILKKSDFEISMIHVTVKYLNEFHSALKDLCSIEESPPAISSNFDVEEWNRFEQKFKNDMTSEMTRKAEKLIHFVTVDMHRNVSRHITGLENIDAELFETFLQE